MYTFGRSITMKKVHISIGLIFVVVGVFFLIFSMANILQRDVRFDVVDVKKTLILPKSQMQVKGGISYNDALGVPQYSDGTDTYVLATGSSGGSTLIYRPNYTGNDPNVFAQWSDLVARSTQLQTPKYIYFDNSLIVDPSTPMVVPAGTWDMTGVTWIKHVSTLQQAPNVYTKVTVEDGATLNGLYGIDGPLEVTYDSSTQNAITLTLTADSRACGFLLTNFALLICPGTYTFMFVSGTGRFDLQISKYGMVGDFTNPIFEYEDVDFELILFTSARVAANSIIGTNGTLQVTILASDVSISYPIDANFPGVPLVNVSTRSTSFTQRHLKNVDPAGTDTTTKGYGIGDTWINTVTDKFFVMVQSGIWNGPY